MARPKSSSSLDATHPALAGQMLPPLDPRQFTATSEDILWWCGPLGHVWPASVADRVAGRGCPVCSSLQAPGEGRSLAQIQPGVAGEADGWDPERVSAGSRVEMPWRCHTDRKSGA